MKLIPYTSKQLLTCRYAFMVLSSIAILSSCQKESKSPAAIDAGSTLREVQTMAALSSSIDTGGLVAWYSFDSGSLRDLSTYNNKIAYSNAELTTDRNGVANNAYHFNGNGSFMAVRNSASLNPSEITLFAIVKFDDFYAGLCHGNRILNKGYSDSREGFYCIGASDDYYTNNMNCSQDVDKEHETFEIGYHGTGAGDYTEYIERGHWYHVVYTYGKGVSNLYVDGKLVQTQTQRALPQSNTDDLYIGTTNRPPTQYPYWFAGSIDQIGIFSKALNATQVAKLSAY